MIENSMFYMNFEVSSDSQKRCVEEIKRIGLDDIMNPIYLLKKPIIDKKADYDYQDAFVVLMPRHKMIFINFGEEGELFEEFQDDFIDDIKLAQYQSLASHKGRVLVYGVGASYIHKGDTLIYCDLARWEIQLRYRKGMPNFKQDNDDEDVLKKIKRSFFIEWRIADKHKMDIFENIDYFLDSNQEGNPKIVTGNALRSALKKTTQRPFRLVPYFDPGVWGGQWMKKNCDLDEKQNNYAWSFDGVPEENSLYFRFGDTRIEIPAMD